jgi:hypothetical protein
VKYIMLPVSPAPGKKIVLLPVCAFRGRNKADSVDFSYGNSKRCEGISDRHGRSPFSILGEFNGMAGI